VSLSANIRQRRRARQLASDARAGAWARAEARRRQYDYLRKHWRRLTVLALFTATATAGLSYLQANQFLAGVVVGAGLVLIFGGIPMLVQLVTGGAQAGMGATAEQWTASELRPLQKIGGRVIHHLSLRRWDIDHVVIVPGGVYAIESKWSGSGWDLERPSPGLRAAIRQVHDNARDLRLWHPIRTAGVGEVRPVLFLWGGTGMAKPATPRRQDGVDVVYGVAAAKVWRSAVSRPDQDGALAAATIEQLWLAASTHIERRDANDSLSAPHPPTLMQIYAHFLVGIGIGPVAAWACLKAFVVVHPWPLFVLAAAAAIMTGLVGRRIAALRVAGTAWAVGVTGGLALIGFVELLYQLG
jgi:hypothetical protein